MFTCANFSQQQLDDDETIASSSPNSSCPTSKKLKPRRSSSLLHRIHGRNSNKNPYANIGLEKFSALVAELDEKRQQIYAQIGSHEQETLVHFVYKKPDDSVPVPIVVVLKDKNKNRHENSKLPCINSGATSPYSSKITKIEEAKKPVTGSEEVDKKRVHKKRSRSEAGELMMPSFYVPVAMILILVLLAVFGRSVSILFTSIGWYVVPALKEYQSLSGRKKKGEIRRSSEKKMVVDQRLLSFKEK